MAPKQTDNKKRKNYINLEREHQESKILAASKQTNYWSELGRKTL